MTSPSTRPATAPAWFLTACERAYEEGWETVAGARVHWVAWGRRTDPTVVLVHGGAAHAWWWQAIGPLLARDRRVVALDLSGHGDSDHRDRYDGAGWAEEILAVTRAAGGEGRPVVVGHSMGGFVTIVLAATHGADLAGAVVVDVPVKRPDPESEEGRGGGMFRAPKRYADLEEAVRHFHLVPPQHCENDWLLDHIARRSLRRERGEWNWKFDPGIFTDRLGPTSPGQFAQQLAQAGCRMAVVNGERSAIVDQEVRQHMVELLSAAPAAAAGVPVIEVPEAHHHVLLDQPLALVTALRGVLAGWDPIGRGPAEVEPVSELA